jgi:mannose-1-phosphate guanylyltransferase
MKAVVLVGGQGTRLRPLTETLKKELLPLVDREVLHHVLDRLARHGVGEVVMSSPYLEESFAPFIAARKGEPAVTWITETEALGTGGAVVSALDHVGDDPFFAVNGDILTDLDLTAMSGFHLERGAAITIALHHVEDVRAFGLVASEPDGRVTEFREKPVDPLPGDINAGTYLMDPAVLRSWTPGRSISIEREIFPEVIRDGRPVFGFAAQAYWMDLGTPEHYLQATFDLLDGRLEGISYAAPWVHGSAEVDLRSHLGRHVSVSARVRVGPEAEIDDSILLEGTAIGAGARVLGSIIAPNVEVGAGATVIGSVVGEGAIVSPGLTIEGGRVAPFTRASA